MHLRWAWLMLALAAPALYAALAHNIGAVGWDAATEHILRGVVFSQAITDGVLYPRWVQFLHLGLGSPLFTFQPPLPYYGMDVLFRLGLSHALGWRLLIAGGLLAAMLGAYALVYAITRQRWAAALAGVAYLYAPYVLLNALERGSNEAFSMFLYPWVLWGLIVVARRPSPGRVVLATLLWAGCIGSHVLGPLMLAPVALALALGLAWRHRTLAPLAVLLLGGLLMAAVWAPMGPEQAWVHVERDFAMPEAQPERNPVPLDQLLAPPAVYDVARDNNGSGNRVGLPDLGLLALAVPAAAWAWRRGRRELALYLAGAVIVGAGLFWLLTSSANGVWTVLKPLLGHLLYRTRLMGLQALMMAVAGGLATAAFGGAAFGGAAPAGAARRWQCIVVPLAAVALIVAALPTLYVDLLHRYMPFDTAVTLADVRAREVVAGGTALTAYGEFMPRWHEGGLSQEFAQASGATLDPNRTPLADGAGIQVNAAAVRSSSWDLTLAASQPVSATLNLFYYPRWQAMLDGQPVQLTPQPVSGLAQVALPAGTHRLVLTYGETPVEVAGLAISGLTLAGLLGWLILATIRQRRTQPAERAQRRQQGLALQTPGTEAVTAPESAAASAAGESAPSPWLLLGVTALVLFKVGFVDGRTSWFRCVSTARQVCGAQTTIHAGFAGGPTLAGYRVDTPAVAPGATLQVTLFWRADLPTDKTLSSFIHLRNSQKSQAVNPRTGSDIWGQDEHTSVGGIVTREFVPGRLYVDEYRVKLPTDLPAGTYYLETGWFDPATGNQLDVDKATLAAPMTELWRSVLLPSVTVR